MKWEVLSYDMNLIESLKLECGITELQAKLLINRGIKDVEDANLFLYGDLRDLYSPKTLNDIDKAVDILVYAKENKSKIFIAGDYDVDGITASVVSKLGFDHIGINSEYYIPHRIKEGYGLSMVAIDDAIKNNFDIIYTVDNGIAAKNEVQKAKDLGLKVIVTDHHDVPKVLKNGCLESINEEDYIEDIPKADAVINPKLKKCNYPNKKICGCVITWKVLVALYERLGVSLDYLYDLLPLVAIATVGDMMDLEKENRILVKEGIKRINKDLNIGVKKLRNIYKIEEMKSENLAFQIIPTLNADGRLDTAYKAANLLYGANVKDLEVILKQLSKLVKVDFDIENENFKEENFSFDENKIKKEIKKIIPDFNIDNSLENIFYELKEEYFNRNKELDLLANTLYETNQKRKELTKQYFEECMETIRLEELDKKNIIVVFNESIPEGLVGLVAGKIKEKFHKPVFVFSNAEEYYKGSGRGVEGHPFSLFDGLQMTKGLWSKGGGHPMAAGVSFEKDIEKLNQFRDILDLYIERLLEENPFEPILKLDSIINTPTEELCREIEVIEPTGKGNPSAAFGTNEVSLLEAKPVGDGTHIRFKITNKIVGIGFSLTSRYNELGHPNSLKFAYAPNINNYTFINSRNEEVTVRSVQMMVHDINLTNEQPQINKNVLISSIKQSILKRK